MNKKSDSLLSRRQFARRAAVLSVTATMAPEAMLPAAPSTAPAQSGQVGSQLSPEGQREVESRYQQILSLYGERLDNAQKANIKKMCSDLQPTLEKIRKFPLQNGNAPALYLKPLVEHQKKPQSATAAKRP